MVRAVVPDASPQAVEAKLAEESLPRPTLLFKRRAWRVFQRALDPLAAAKPLRPPKR